MQDQLAAFLEQGIDPNNIELLNQKAKQIGIAPCAYAALDIALWDWKAKKAQLPLNQLLDIPRPTVPTSLTLGIIPRSGQRKNSTDVTKLLRKSPKNKTRVPKGS